MSRLRQTISDFIEMYRSEPCLWKMQSREYQDRNKKCRAYDKLVTKLKEIEPDADRNTVTKKINNLRSTYRKELKKVKFSKNTCTDPDDVYVPKLWYFDNLRFLYDQEDVTSADSAANNFEDSEGEELDDYGDYLQPKLELVESEEDTTSINNNYIIPAIINNANYGNTTTASVIPERERKRTHVDSTSESSRNDQSKKQRQSEDCFDVFGRIVAYKLRDMDKTQRILAEKFINDALFEGELGTLTRNHKLVNE